MTNSRPFDQFKGSFLTIKTCKSFNHSYHRSKSINNHRDQPLMSWLYGHADGAGDWEDITPLERQKNQDLASFLFKAPLINRVQRAFLWPLDKVHAVLAEYLRWLILKDELEDFDGHILAVPPIIAKVWESHIVDTADYRNCLEKVID